MSKNVDTRAETEAIRAKCAAITAGPDQTIDTRPKHNPVAEDRMREAVAAAEATAAEVEELRAAGPSRHAKALELLSQERDALRTEADRLHEHLDEARATIERQSKIIEGLHGEIVDHQNHIELLADRLHRYEVDGEPVRTHAPKFEPTEPPLVKLGQGREDDEPSGPPLVGVMILGLIAVVVVVAVIVIATRTGGIR